MKYVVQFTKPKPKLFVITWGHTVNMCIIINNNSWYLLGTHNVPGVQSTLHLLLHFCNIIGAILRSLVFK